MDEGETGASYKKLRDGSWGIRTVGYVPDVGDTVDVETKAGEVKQEEVSRIVWSGQQDDGADTAICEVVQTDRDGNRIEKPKQQQRQGGQGQGNRQQSQGNRQGGGQQRQAQSKCKCLGCGTTDPAKEYYCSDCVLNGTAAAKPNAGVGSDNTDQPFTGNDDDEIPF